MLCQKWMTIKKEKQEQKKLRLAADQDLLFQQTDMFLPQTMLWQTLRQITQL